MQGIFQATRDSRKSGIWVSVQHVTLRNSQHWRWGLSGTRVHKLFTTAIQPIDGCMNSPIGTTKQLQQVFRLTTTNPEKSVKFFQNISVFPCSMILVLWSQVRHSIKFAHLRSHQIPFTSIEKCIPFFYLYDISPSPPIPLCWVDGRNYYILLVWCERYREKDFLGGWTKLLCKVMGVRLG